MEKLIITVAPTGSFTTRDKTPFLPMTPPEIAEECYKAYEAGAAIAHIHVRDSEGRPSQDVDLFREVHDRIKEKTDLIVQFSSSAGALVTGAGPEERIAPIITIRPEMASLNLSSMNLGGHLFSNPPDVVESFSKFMLEKRIKPELECYDVGHISIALDLKMKGFLRAPLRFGLVLGTVGGIPATPKNLLHMVEALPENCNWQVIAVGRNEIPLGTLGMILGGHVRVGMEDNTYLFRGVLAKSNSELVDKIVRISKELDRKIADPSEARDLLDI